MRVAFKVFMLLLALFIVVVVVSRVTRNGNDFACRNNEIFMFQRVLCVGKVAFSPIGKRSSCQKRATLVVIQHLAALSALFGLIYRCAGWEKRRCNSHRRSIAFEL